MAPAKLKVFSEDGTWQTYGSPQIAARALEEWGLLAGVRDLPEAARQNTQRTDRDTHQQQRWEVDKRRWSSRNIAELMQEAEKNLGLSE